MFVKNNICDGDIPVRAYAKAIMEDPYRPSWHFVIPAGNGYPFDPNGAFFADGRYHLMYLYRDMEKLVYQWGHVSSIDLLHWRNHPDCLTDFEGDEGCFSGGGFLDEDGAAYLSFWKFPKKDDPTKTDSGICLARAYPPYDHWERLPGIAVPNIGDEWGICELTVNGKQLHVACADPSNIWKSGDTYYMQMGCLPVMNKYGRADDAPDEYAFDFTDLFCSKDLVHWDYVHRFYENPRKDETYPERGEDDMCPSFLRLPDQKSGGKLTDNYLQLYISHNHGAQYYIGKYDEIHQKFILESHGRFSWADNACFAPEALIDDKNRHIVWYWLMDNILDDYHYFGWTGTYAVPRTLWLQDGILHMAPVEELEKIMTHRVCREHIALSDGQCQKVTVTDPYSYRIQAEIAVGTARKVGFTVCSDGTEYASIYYDAEKGELVNDTSSCGKAWSEEEWNGRREAAPFRLREGETLKLDIMVDHAVIEVFANERQAISRRLFVEHPREAVGISTITVGGNAEILSLVTAQIEPTNPY